MLKLLLGFALVLASCESIETRTIKSIPLMQEYIGNPNLDEIVRQGLMDGCVTASASRGNSFYKSTLYFRQDVEKVHDSRYTLAWKNGYGICFPEANQYSFMQFGSKTIHVNHPAAWIQPFGRGATTPIGNDAESRPAVWYFDESINNGIPTNAYYHNPTNIYGVFGSCYLC